MVDRLAGFLHIAMRVLYTCSNRITEIEQQKEQVKKNSALQKILTNLSGELEIRLIA